MSKSGGERNRMRKREQRIRQINKFTCRCQFREHATCKLENSRRESELLGRILWRHPARGEHFFPETVLWFFSRVCLELYRLLALLSIRRARRRVKSAISVTCVWPWSLSRYLLSRNCWRKLSPSAVMSVDTFLTVNMCIYINRGHPCTPNPSRSALSLTRPVYIVVKSRRESANFDWCLSISFSLTFIHKAKQLTNKVSNGRPFCEKRVRSKRKRWIKILKVIKFLIDYYLLWDVKLVN